MTPQEAAEPLHSQWQGFFDEFSEESARAAAIVAGTFLDGLLRELITGALVGTKSAQVALLGEDDGGDAPLATFSARIRAAYALGLISSGERHDLDLIRRVRNKFAHAPHGFSFNDSKVAEWCQSLQLAGEIARLTPPKFDGHRDRFQLGVALVAMSLTSRIAQSSGHRPKVPSNYRLGSIVSVNGATRQA